ncbi:MAG: hypothetical protein JEZ05_08375 [Tenericutes bacterium]|nr:hypothetical protein [Mycoplasmatota bacterium]
MVNLRKLTSTFGEVPYEKEFLDHPELVASVMRTIFEDIDDGKIYESQILNIILGPMAQTTVYLELDDLELICDFYYYEETNETAFRLYIRENDSLVFYHDFENRFQEEYSQILELL